MAAKWCVIVDVLREGCATAGLDIVHPFAVSEYNAGVSAEWRIEDFGRARALGVIFANTRALWAPFLQALQGDAALARDEHPLERYVQARLAPLLERVSERHAIYWAHQTSPRALPIQRLAELVGLASLSPSHLSIHPLHGPWLALRAVAVIDVAGPDEPAPTLQSPCVGCDKPCMAALEHALAESGQEPGTREVAEHAADWIAIRDACPVGRASRYGEQQLRYHYTKDRKALR